MPRFRSASELAFRLTALTDILRLALTATTDIIRTLARLMAITVPRGSPAASSLAPGPGITTGMAATTATAAAIMDGLFMGIRDMVMGVPDMVMDDRVMLDDPFLMPADMLWFEAALPVEAASTVTSAAASTVAPVVVDSTAAVAAMAVAVTGKDVAYS